MSRQIVSTNVRFNLEKEPDRMAWEYLRQRDKRQYRSYSTAVGDTYGLIAPMILFVAHIQQFALPRQYVQV